MTTFFAVVGMWFMQRRHRNLNPSARILSHALLGTACAQVSLGIATLLTYVPVELAAMHQAGSLTLLSVAVALMHFLP